MNYTILKQGPKIGSEMSFYFALVFLILFVASVLIINSLGFGPSLMKNIDSISDSGTLQRWQVGCAYTPAGKGVWSWSDMDCNSP